MNKKEFIAKVVDVLQQNDIRKPVAAQKTVLHITDDDGHCSDFTIRKDSTKLLFTVSDIAAILDAMLAVTEDSLKHGEEVNLHGFGSLALHHRAARQTKHPDTGDVVDVAARYVPKFSFGKNLKIAAKLYELSLSDRNPDEEVENDG